MPLDGNFWVQDSNLASMRKNWVIIGGWHKGLRIQIQKKKRSGKLIKSLFKDKNKELWNGKSLSRQPNKEIQVTMNTYVGEHMIFNSRNLSDEIFSCLIDFQDLSLKTFQARENNRTKGNLTNRNNNHRVL